MSNVHPLFTTRTDAPEALLEALRDAHANLPRTWPNYDNTAGALQSAISHVRSYIQSPTMSTSETHKQALVAREYALDALFRDRRMPEHSLLSVLNSFTLVASIGHWRYIRPSLDDLTQLSFFASEEHAIIGRRTRAKPGRVLNRIKEWMGDDARRDWFDRVLDGDYRLNFTVWVSQAANAYVVSRNPPDCGWCEGAKHIAELYKTGPSSCMSYDFEGLPHHPSEAYDSPDVRVAFAKKGGSYVARAVCNELNKTFYRIYGNTEALHSWLESQGYSSGHGLRGCRLKRIEHDNGFILPYVDGNADSATDDGEWMVLDGGPYYGGTRGWCPDQRIQCDSCGDDVSHEDSLTTTLDDTRVCDACLDSCYSYAIIGSYQWRGMAGREFAWVEDDEVYGHDEAGDPYTEEGAQAFNMVKVYSRPGSIDYVLMSEGDAAYCNSSGEFYRSDDCFVCAYGGETYHDSYVAEAPDGEVVHRDHLHDYCEAHGLTLDEAA